MFGLKWKTVLLITGIHTGFVCYALSQEAQNEIGMSVSLAFVSLFDFPTISLLSLILYPIGLDLGDMNLWALGLLIGIAGTFQWMIIARLLWPITFGYEPDMSWIDERIRAGRRKRGLPDLTGREATETHDADSG